MSKEDLTVIYEDDGPADKSDELLDLDILQNDEDEGGEVDHKKLASKYKVSEEVLETAMGQGWVPEENWEGDPDKWVTPKEFIFRGELYDRIKKESRLRSSLENKLEEVTSALQKLGEHNSKLAKVEREKALKELRKERISAIREGDDEMALDIEDKIAEFEKLEDKDTTPVTKVEDKPDPKVEEAAQKAFTTWVENNSWYNEKPALRAAAQALGEEILGEYRSEGELPDMEVLLSDITQRMKSEGLLSKTAGNPMRGARSGIEGDTTRSTKGRRSKFTEKDLSPEQRKFAKTFISQGVLTMDQYIDQLVDVGELG